MTLASYGWQKLDSGKRRRFRAFSEVLPFVRSKYPNVIQEGSTNGYSYWLNGEVIGLAWPVKNNLTDWWCAIKK